MPEGKCPACFKWLDAFGDHAVCCASGGSRILRHDSGRDILVCYAKTAGIKAAKEQQCAGSERPADALLRGLANNGKADVVDLCYTDIRSGENAAKIAKDGAGAAAEAYGAAVKGPKLDKLNNQLYNPHAFAVETSGAFSPTALALIKAIEAHRRQICPTNEKRIESSPLLTSLSVDCQRHCSAMICERMPIHEEKQLPKLLRIERRNIALEVEAKEREEKAEKRRKNEIDIRRISKIPLPSSPPPPQSPLLPPSPLPYHLCKFM